LTIFLKAIYCAASLISRVFWLGWWRGYLGFIWLKKIQKSLDGLGGVLHNLVSLLLTNQTKRRGGE